MGTQLPPEKLAHPPTQFLAHVYCGQTAGWMKTPLGTEVDLGTGYLHHSKVHKIQLQCHQHIITVNKWNATKTQFSRQIYAMQPVPKSSDKNEYTPRNKRNLLCRIKCINVAVNIRALRQTAYLHRQLYVESFFGTLYRPTRCRGKPEALTTVSVKGVRYFTR